MNEKFLIEALIRQRDHALNRVAQLEAALNEQAAKEAAEKNEYTPAAKED